MYTTDDSGDGCTQGLTWQSVSPTGSGSGFAYEDADEDTTYTKQFTPTTTGLWRVFGNLGWSTQNPPVDLNTILSNNLFVQVWREMDPPREEIEDESVAPTPLSWTEEVKPTGSFSESAKPTGGFAENSKPSGTWTERESIDASQLYGRYPGDGAQEHGW